MSARRTAALVAGLLLAGGAAWWWWQPADRPRAPAAAPATPPPLDPQTSAGAAIRAPVPGAPTPPAASAQSPADATPITERSHLADQLNAASGTIQQDLEIVQEVLGAWRTNFHGQGNPVGDNREITAALTGKNRIGFAFVPGDHPAVNAEGQLCDRWGTPFFFHQISGTRMEVVSAGPDRRMHTKDDVMLTPEAPPPAPIP